MVDFPIRDTHGHPEGLEPDTFYYLFVADDGSGRASLPVPNIKNLHPFEFSKEADGGALNELGPVRRVFSVLTDKHGNIRPFKISGNTFTWDAPEPDELAAISLKNLSHSSRAGE